MVILEKHDKHQLYSDLVHSTSTVARKGKCGVDVSRCECRNCFYILHKSL